MSIRTTYYDDEISVSFFRHRGKIVLFEAKNNSNIHTSLRFNLVVMFDGA